METVFAARTTYSEQMYYHVVAAGQQKEPAKKKKDSVFEGIGMTEFILAPVMFFVFFMTFPQADLSLRLGQSLLATMITLVLLIYVNKRKNSGKKRQTTAQKRTEMCKSQARTMLESGGLSGVRCSLTFYEECFRYENPGITTDYSYERIVWVKETSKYYLLYLNRSMALAVEKTGFYKGRQEQFLPFIEKKCRKTVEKVKVSA